MEQCRFNRETRFGGVVGDTQPWYVFVCDAQGAGLGGDWGEDKCVK